MSDVAEWNFSFGIGAANFQGDALWAFYSTINQRNEVLGTESWIAWGAGNWLYRQATALLTTDLLILTSHDVMSRNNICAYSVMPSIIISWCHIKNFVFRTYLSCKSLMLELRLCHDRTLSFTLQEVLSTLTYGWILSFDRSLLHSWVHLFGKNNFNSKTW